MEFINKHIGIFIYLAVVILGSVLYFTCRPRIVLDDGTGNVTISYNSSYLIPKGHLYILNFKISDDVEVEGSLDTKRIGEYTLKYTNRSLFYNVYQTKKIKVVDEEKPTLELKGSNQVSLCPNTIYNEEGYEAKDEYDGDLTSKVLVSEKDNHIMYQVSDSSNNTTSKDRIITYEDKEAPTITLNGSSSITIYQNSSYYEQGARASDNCDGDITSNIAASGRVDSSKLGSYKITYKVSDKSGNEASALRTVKVVEKPSTTGVIYLTFDDGPSDANTSYILDVLKKYGVKATFFVTGKGSDALIKREYDEGHAIGLHSYTHDYAKVYQSEAAFYQDLNAISDRVKRITGAESKIIRFPGGSSNTVSRNYNKGIMSRLTKDVIARGYQYFDWNISSGDAGGTTTGDGVYNNVVSHLYNDGRNIVLMHDIHNWTRDAIERIVKYGINNGYTFDVLTVNSWGAHHGVNN